MSAEEPTSQDHPPTGLSENEWYLIAQEKEHRISELELELHLVKVKLVELATALETAGVELYDPNDPNTPVAPGELLDDDNERRLATLYLQAGAGTAAAGAADKQDGPPREAEPASGEGGEGAASPTPPSRPAPSAAGMSPRTTKILVPLTDVKLNMKAVIMMGDEKLEKDNLAFMDEEQKKKMNEKAAKLVGSNVVLKKKLRDRFGSEMHIESIEMMKAKEKYEKLKAESMAGWVTGSVEEKLLDLKHQFSK